MSERISSPHHSLPPVAHPAADPAADPAIVGGEPAATNHILLGVSSQSQTSANTEIQFTAGAVTATISPQEARCLKMLYALSEDSNQKFLVSAIKVDEFLECYRSLAPDSVVKKDIATEINNKGVFLQTPILSACLAKISTHFVTLCDIASELLTSGYSESSKGNEVLILSQLVYCIGVGGDREKRILSATAQLSKIIEAFLDKKIIIDRSSDRVSRGWSNLIESLNMLSEIPEPLAGSLYKVLPPIDTKKSSLIQMLPIVEEAPLSFFSYAPNTAKDTVASLSVNLLTLAKTPHEQRKIARILSARIEEFHAQYPTQENPFTKPVLELLSRIDRDPLRDKRVAKNFSTSDSDRPLEVSTFVSLIKLSCTLQACGELRPFHTLCNASSKRMQEVKKKTLLMTPLSEYPSTVMQEEAVQVRLQPLFTPKRMHQSQVKQFTEALSFAAEKFDGDALSRIFKSQLAPLVRRHVGLLGRFSREESILTREPELADAVLKILGKLRQTREVRSVKQGVEKLSKDRK